jgi:phenylpropionate dioxygenase-like ring-hydroxylating dioxygenase large terminal subunit
MKVAGELDFTGYKLDQVEMHECNYNWKTFIEVYLEDYHVVPFPPRAGQLRDLRRSELAVRRLVFGAAGRHHLARQARLGHLRAVAEGGDASTTARTSPHTARSG